MNDDNRVDSVVHLLATVCVERRPEVVVWLSLNLLIVCGMCVCSLSGARRALKALVCRWCRWLLGALDCLVICLSFTAIVYSDGV